MEHEGASSHSTFPEEVVDDGGENEHQRRRLSSLQSPFPSSPRSRYWQKPPSNNNNHIYTKYLAQPVSGKRKRKSTARVFVTWISVGFFLFLLFNIIWVYFDLQDGSRGSMSTLRNISFSSSSNGTGKILVLPQKVAITLKVPMPH